MDNLHCKFLCCYNVSLINWPETLKFSNTWEKQKILVDQTINHKLNIIAPVKRSYQIAFLKQIINYFESENVEIHDEIYEKLCTLQSISSNENNFTFKHYCIPKLDVIISLKESNSFVTDGTTGLCSWQASLLLSDWLVQNKLIVSEKDVLELGSGTGLCGFIASKYCNAKKVVMSDGSTQVIDLLKNNLAINCKNYNVQLLTDNYTLYQIDKSQQIATLLLPWENIEKLNMESIIQPEIILGADIVYDSSIFEALSNAIIYIFKYMKNKCKLILAATVRNEKTLSDFIQILIKLEFTVNKCSVSSRYFFWDPSNHIELFIITKIKKF